MGDSYKLRCSLLGHTSDVRGVATGRSEGGKEYILSGSRDLSAKVWMPSDRDNSFIQVQSCEGHTKYVNCVYTIPPNEKHPSGLILSGGQDYTILAFEMGKAQPIFRLVGHKGNVCSIGSTSNSLIVSGSWDLSAKVWKEQDCIATLEGHTAAVWAVATVPSRNGQEDCILTGSADKEIRLWVNYKSTVTFIGHTDCVRTLAVMTSERFLSAANDATIRLWNIFGETLKILYGHTNFIYSICLIDGGFVSVGEDRTLRIWKNFETIQVLFHPATSVWTVSALSNGDIVTGCSDGTIRVFTKEESRMGSPQVLAAFEDEVSTSVVAAQQDLGGMKISELPGPESLLIEGRSDGETKMVREGDKVGCFSWSTSDRKWTKVGDVVGASGATQNTSGKVLYEGKEYDYVFSVELEDGMKPLKLPYNVTEDPWFAAQKFIHKNDLSQTFLDQVADFIVKNTKGMQLTSASASNDYVDPFTGGSRYVPGSAVASSSRDAANQPYEPTANPHAVYYCPLIGKGTGSYAEIEEKIKQYLMRQPEEDGITACQIIHSCNKPPEKVTNCVSTLTKIFENIVASPSEQKFRKIRCSNKAIQQKVLSTLGAELYLISAGFQKTQQLTDDGSQQTEDFLVYNATDVSRLTYLREMLMQTQPIKPEAVG